MKTSKTSPGKKKKKIQFSPVPSLPTNSIIRVASPVPRLPVNGVTREDSPAPLLERDLAEESSSDTSADSQESSSTSISVQGFVPSPAIMDMPGVISAERMTLVQDTQAPGDADGAASEGDDPTQDDLSTDPFDNSSAEDEQDSVLAPQSDDLSLLNAGTSSSTTTIEAPIDSATAPTSASLSVTAFIQACMCVMEDANTALDDPNSELSAIFPSDIHTRRTFLKTALSLIANWRTYKKVSQRDVFFGSEFSITDDNLMKDIQIFNSALFGIETGKYGLIRSVYLVKIIQLLMQISKNNYADDSEKQEEIRNNLIKVIKIFSQSSVNEAYQDNTVVELFSQYLDEQANILFTRYRNNMIAADQQLKAADILIKHFPYRLASDTIKNSMLHAFKAGLLVGLEAAADFELAATLDRKLAAIANPEHVLAKLPEDPRYQNHWTTLNAWSTGLDRDPDNEESRLSSLLGLIASKNDFGVMYITGLSLQQIKALRRGEILAQSFDEELLQHTNNESAQFMLQFLDPQQLNQADFERYLGVIDSSITDFDGHALSSNQTSNPHLEIKKALAITQPTCSSSVDPGGLGQQTRQNSTDLDTPSSRSHHHRDRTSGIGIFGRLSPFGKKPAPSATASTPSHVGSSKVTDTSSSSMPKPPSSGSVSPSDNETEKRAANPLFGKPIPRSYSSSIPKPPSGGSVSPSDNETEKRAANPLFVKSIPRS